MSDINDVGKVGDMVNKARADGKAEGHGRGYGRGFSGDWSAQGAHPRP